MKRTWIAVGIALAAIGLLLWRLADVLAPVAVALLLAYLCEPLVGRLARRVPRSVAALGAVLVVVLAAVGLALIVLPLLAHELGLFAERVPAYVDRVWNAVVPWIEQRFGFRVPASTAEVKLLVGDRAREMAQHLVEPLRIAFGGLFAGLGGLIGVVVQVVMVPVFVYFLSRGWPTGAAFFASLVPSAWRGRVLSITGEIDHSIAQWLRGQLGVMLAQGVLYAIGLSIVGIHFAVLIGLLAGLLAFIPYAGAIVGLTLALLMAVVDFSGWGPVVGVAVVFAAVQSLDAVLITPRLVGERTGLGPLGVILSLLIFGELFGFTGVLLAVPLGASALIVARHLVAAYRATDLFSRAAAAGTDGPPAAGAPDPTPDRTGVTDERASP